MPDFQKNFLARPLVEQMALAEADDDEVQAIAERHGYQVSSAVAERPSRKRACVPLALGVGRESGGEALDRSKPAATLRLA